MGRLVTWLGGALGLAALWRFLRREHEAAHPAPPQEPEPDPAAELRAKLEEARDAADDRDEFDAAEGQPVDLAEPAENLPAAEPASPVESRSVDERRRAVHEKAQQALGEMQRPPGE
jgi:hypothetical protein